MKPRITLSVDKMLEISSASKFKRKLILKSIKWLEDYFGSRVFLEVPEGLSNFEPEIFPLLDKITQMKNEGMIKGELIRCPSGIKELSKKFHLSEFLEDEPSIFLYLIPFRTKNSAIGKDFFSEKKALQRCIGEISERYNWLYTSSFYENKIKKASYAELIKSKKLVANIFNIAGFTEEQKKQYEHLQFNENTEFGWIQAHSLLGNKKVFCPLQLFSSVYYLKKTKFKTKGQDNLSKSEPLLRWGTSSGSAAGGNLESAILGGIMEIIEREAIMVTHLNKISPPQYELESLYHDKDIKEVLERFSRYNLEVYLFDLPTDFPVFVTAAVVVDRTGVGPALTFGASADFEIKEGILDALAENVSLRFARHKIKNKINIQNDLTQSGRVIYWFKQENFSKMDFLFRGKKIKLDINKDKKIFFGESKKDVHKDKREALKKLDILKKGFIKNECHLYWLETTSPKTRKIGIRTVYAFSPEVQPLHLHETIPYFGGSRLKSVPIKLGYKPAEELNLYPQPLG
jgi:ribosomal protein S12 methylthiotransferase accessory factor